MTTEKRGNFKLSKKGLEWVAKITPRMGKFVNQQGVMGGGKLESQKIRGWVSFWLKINEG